MTGIGGTMRIGIEGSDGSSTVLEREGSGVDGRERREEGAGTLDMTVIVHIDIMTDLQDHEILPTATTGGGPGLQYPQHVVVVRSYLSK